MTWLPVLQRLLETFKLKQNRKTHTKWKNYQKNIYFKINKKNNCENAIKFMANKEKHIFP